ncbi:cyclic AMP-responsive element-binding protein 3-like protein 3 [Galendromus occidentalis]|uniref:Cyclic AMP-responsive element-binding protein 3-like protein 3 n=1 Tax=Galendromus occidentalis TaxID=34638 RepID=A0AAJ6W0I4_9ACAR|nr:cyclic AMP-responsive element-binding protein 3-like protein 3 [Galendromus occidentalis]
MDASEEWLLGDVEDTGGNPILFQDRMISDSVEYEHSYSNAMQVIKEERDLDEECFPTVSLSSASGQGAFIKSEVGSRPISPPAPPYTRIVNANIVAGTVVCKPSSKASKNRLLATALSAPPLASLLKQGTHILPIGVTQVKVELPPTPPSSTSSSNESESDGSTSPLHSAHGLVYKKRVCATINTNADGSSVEGLALTEEEKRTLIAEGYPIPQKLPLTKAEERSLKKIRRKIKNKISAQESRRKKKEYVDALEKRVEQLAAESRDMRKVCESLEEANKVLQQQLKILQEQQKEVLLKDECQEEMIEEEEILADGLDEVQEELTEEEIIVNVTEDMC